MYRAQKPCRALGQNEIGVKKQRILSSCLCVHCTTGPIFISLMEKFLISSLFKCDISRAGLDFQLCDQKCYNKCNTTFLVFPTRPRRDRHLSFMKWYFSIFTSQKYDFLHLRHVLFQKKKKKGRKPYGPSSTVDHRTTLVYIATSLSVGHQNHSNLYKVRVTISHKSIQNISISSPLIISHII